jgi:hypothetical protein
MYFKLFSTSSTPKGPLISDSRLLELFRKEYPTLIKITTKKQITELVNYNKSVATWYRNIRVEASTIRSMPKAFLDAGFTTSDWTDLGPSRSILDKGNQDYANLANSFSKEHSDKMKALLENRKKIIDRLPAPVLIAELSVNHLPIDVQVEMLLKDDVDARQQYADEELYKLQLMLLKEYKATGKVNFDFSL